VGYRQFHFNNRTESRRVARLLASAIRFAGLLRQQRIRDYGRRVKSTGFWVGGSNFSSSDPPLRNFGEGEAQIVERLVYAGRA